jgi:SAM-dependent methyltransferase
VNHVRYSLELVNNKSFFDAHAHAHEYHKDVEFYYRPLVTILKNTVLPERILDIGCGDGSFFKSITEEGITTYYLGIDLSSSMIQSAMENIRNRDTNLIVADVFRLPLVPYQQFDLIHIDSVIHHLIGKTRSKSKELAKDVLDILFARLSKGGHIVVEEVYYESHITSGLTATVAFYGLKLMNFLKLNLSSLSKVIYPGLEVNFYSERELIKMLSQYGDVQVMKRIPYHNERLHRLFLLKDQGHISFIIKKDRNAK